jgi:two-component system KDP operon response regulator KdpE
MSGWRRRAGQLVVDIRLRKAGDVVRRDAAGDARDGGKRQADCNHHADDPYAGEKYASSHPLILAYRAAQTAQGGCKSASSLDFVSGDDDRSAVPWAGMAKVLIVEDDDRVRTPLVHALTSRGHVVTEASSGLPALQSVVDDAPDVVILDLGLPDIDGGDLLKMLRAVSSVPLIVGTARDDEHEIVRLLDAGADDYIVKPFSAEQLDARIRALLRRTASEAPQRLEIGDLVIDAAARTATLGGESLALSRKEFDVLFYLASHCGSVVTKQELLAEVWDQPFGGVEKTVDTHLSWLRAKLSESANAPRYLHTVRGVGVKLVAPDD